MIFFLYFLLLLFFYYDSMILFLLFILCMDSYKKAENENRKTHCQIMNIDKSAKQTYILVFEYLYKDEKKRKENQTYCNLYGILFERLLFTQSLFHLPVAPIFLFIHWYWVVAVAAVDADCRKFLWNNHKQPNHKNKNLLQIRSKDDGNETGELNKKKI